MQKIRTFIRNTLQRLRTPEFITGTATGILAALLLEAISEAVQKSLNHQIVGFLLMAVVALVCLILIGYFLMRIEKLVENRNYTRFITSKAERLNLMTYCINNATKSIYIISDLSDTEETQMDEHEEYLEALNQVMKSKKVEVKRIVMPPYVNGKDSAVDFDWIYTTPTKPAYQKHFKLLQDYDNYAMSHTNVPLNVSMILIDNKYLFWKPELTYGDKELEKLFDGGLYWEDYTLEGLAHFIKTFEKLEKRKARWTDPAKAPWNSPDQFDSTKPKIE
jgi:hypothetical protein